MIPSRACASLINAIQATTMAAILTAAGAPPVQATATIPDRAPAPVPDPALTADLDQTAAAAMTIITVANRRS
jgi:hypothetical protein